jgi:iron complex outermembrane recepter protein
MEPITTGRFAPTNALNATPDGSKLLDQACHDYHGTPLLPRDVRRYDRVVGRALRWKH